MRYDYKCSNSKCRRVQEEVHGMLESPVIVCMKCGYQAFRMISVGSDQIFAANVPLYDFVDYKTTTQPTRIRSKREWNEHLKRVGQVEAPNTPPTKAQLESEERTKKMVAKRELKETIVKAVKDKRYIREVKQKTLQTAKGGK